MGDVKLFDMSQATVLKNVMVYGLPEDYLAAVSPDYYIPKEVDQEYDNEQIEPRRVG